MLKVGSNDGGDHIGRWKLAEFVWTTTILKQQVRFNGFTCIRLGCFGLYICALMNRVLSMLWICLVPSTINMYLFHSLLHNLQNFMTKDIEKS